MEKQKEDGEKRKSLRLYDSAHLNDPDEGNFLIRSLDPEGKYNWISEGSIAHAYVTSFIIPKKDKDMRDNLVFWRAYGSEGEGCSLTVHVPPQHLRRVVYDPVEVQDTVQKLLPTLQTIEPIVAVKQPFEHQIKRELSDAFRESLGQVQYLYKSQAYEYEEECRFVITRSEVSENQIYFDYRHQDGSAHLRHYCEHEDLDLERMAVSGSAITLGPRVFRSDDVRRSLEVLRSRAGLENRLQVRPSRIPFYRKT